MGRGPSPLVQGLDAETREPCARNPRRGMCAAAVAAGSGRNGAFTEHDHFEHLVGARYVGRGSVSCIAAADEKRLI